MADNMMVIFFDPEAITQAVDSDKQTLLWTFEKGQENLRLLDRIGSQEGFCYVRALAFCCDFARIPQHRFRDMVTEMTAVVGKNPTAMTVLTEVSAMFLLEFATPSWINSPDFVRGMRGRMNASKIKVKFTEGDHDLMHLEPLGSAPFCECESPICQHGYDFRMASALGLKRERRWGASNFDMGEFLSSSMGQEEEFDDVYSQLEPEPEVVSKSKAAVTNWEQNQLPSPQSSPKAESGFKDMEMRMRQMEAELRLAKEQAIIKPAPLRPSPRTELTIDPGDSSSIISRYGRQFMGQGTVLSPREMASAADRLDGRTSMAVQDDLVSGFNMTEDLVRIEQNSVRKLRPINGLPRPFTCRRLNFLANLHTGIQRAIERRPDSLQTAMFRAMRRRPELPCDELLYQVLTCTIDRTSNTFTSNAFSLPYIEVGMHITEESIAKAFDLLESEYKTKWFQEMKNISVPNFHDRFKGFSKDTMQVDSGERRAKAHSEHSQDRTKKQRKGSSLLGFRN